MAVTIRRSNWYVILVTQSYRDVVNEEFIIDND